MKWFIILQMCLLVAWYSVAPALPVWLVFLPSIWIVVGTLLALWAYARLSGRGRG